jgi:hypothetical protein
MVKFAIEESLDWRWWVTPKLLADKPIHRWYIFPHSFTSELVHALIEEWGLDDNDHILDPFAGAGTTLLASKEKGIPATGYDISPLAVFTSRAKLANYNIPRLENAWQRLQRHINPTHWNGTLLTYPELVKKALSGKLLGAFDAIKHDIVNLDASETEKNFFRLALLKILPNFSRAVATGGWLSWVKKRNGVSTILAKLSEQVNLMLGDVRKSDLSHRSYWEVKKEDARKLPDINNVYSAVITSPPYPNRHDYTRVFGVELMFYFLDWNGTRQIRYQSFESHPEAHPLRPNADDYIKPRTLVRNIARIRCKSSEVRIPNMLEGYFLDIYLTLREVKRICRKNAHIAFVVGNAQYFGCPVPVDQLTAEIGESVGLKCSKIRAARFRGNSAQQMSRFGRKPSRESLVIFTAS